MADDRSQWIFEAIDKVNPVLKDLQKRFQGVSQVTDKLDKGGMASAKRMNKAFGGSCPAASTAWNRSCMS